PSAEELQRRAMRGVVAECDVAVEDAQGAVHDRRLVGTDDPRQVAAQVGEAERGGDGDGDEEPGEQDRVEPASVFLGRHRSSLGSRPVHALFTYGAGVPRYLGLWLVLTPVLVAGLLAFGVRRGAVLAVALTTLPSLTRNPPQWLGPGFQYVMMAVLLVYVTAWL